MQVGPTSDGGPNPQATSPETVSIASDTGSAPTRRDLSRVKRWLVRVSENLRGQLQQQQGQLMDNKTAIETPLSRDTQSRLADRRADLELQAL